MPIIAFDPTEPDRTVFNLIWGRQQFPHDNDKAFELFVLNELLYAGLASAGNDERLDIPVSWVKALAFGPSLAEVRKGGEIRSRQGFTAGALLWSAYLYRQTGRRVTLNAAIEVLTQAVERGEGDLPYPMRPYSNKPEIHRAWKAMQPVAHLWAGLALVETLQASQGIPKDALAARYSLGLARGFLSWAASEDGGRLLDHATAWDLPDCVEKIDLQTLPAESVPAFIRETATRKRSQ
jgi:hypothetical protein